jgi:hypothetical protein
MAPRETGSVANGTTRHPGGTKAAMEKSPAERASQSTLTPADLAPAWHGPPPHKDAKRSV